MELEIRQRFDTIYGGADILYDDDLKHYGEVAMFKALEAYETAKKRPNFKPYGNTGESRAYYQAILKGNKEREESKKQVEKEVHTEQEIADRRKARQQRYVAYARNLTDQSRDELVALLPHLSKDDRAYGAMEYLHVVLVEMFGIELDSARKESTLFWMACKKRDKDNRYNLWLKAAGVSACPVPVVPVKHDEPTKTDDFWNGDVPF